LAAAQFVVAAIGGDPQEPGAEQSATELVQRAVGEQERILGHILGGVGLADHPQRHVVDLALV
jgi:hypothetical protein